MLRSFVLCLAALASLTSLPARGAEAKSASSLAPFQGAWVQPSTECDEVYVKTKQGMAFKRPVSVFAPAILISGRRISTPGAACTINSVSPAEGNRQLLNLSCSSTIATDPVKALVSISDDGALYRYSRTDDNGTRYVRCGP